MFIINTIILSLTVCIDSFLLCLFSKKNNKFNYFLIPFTFSFFQIIFLLTGYFLGDFLETYLHNYFKYIIFIIFSSMAIKLIIDTLLNKGKEENKKTCHLTFKGIIFQAMITSSDSLLLGLPLAFKSNSYLILIIIIGLTTFIACLLGLLLRDKINETHEDKIFLGGAIILFVFAFKSLL